MTLVVFDLDGTLLNKGSQVSAYTAETLAMMRARNIPYTVATGRTLQAAAAPLKDHYFTLPMILKNGAIIWSPDEERYSHHHLLTREEVWHVMAAFTLNDLTPFVFSLQPGQKHALYHGPLKSRSEHKLADLFEAERHLPLAPLSAMPDEISVINVFSLGGAQAVQRVSDSIADEHHLVAYSGVAIHEREMGNAEMEPALHWVDIHCYYITLKTSLVMSIVYLFFVMSSSCPCLMSPKFTTYLSDFYALLSIPTFSRCICLQSPLTPSAVLSVRPPNCFSSSSFIFRSPLPFLFR